MGNDGTPSKNAAPCHLCLTSKSPPIISPNPEITSNTTPIVAQVVVTTFQSNAESNNELNPHRRKKEVINHLCLPSAYSLIIRQLGLYSGLTKCRMNKDKSESAPLAIVNVASIFIVLNFIGLKQFFQLIKTHRNTLLKAHFNYSLYISFGWVDHLKFYPCSILRLGKYIFPF